MWSAKGVARAARMNATASARMRMPRAAVGQYAYRAARSFPPPKGLRAPLAGTMARNPVAQAIKGKGISRAVAGGAIGAAAIGGFRNRSGRPADKVSGRPTGMYGY